MIPTAKSAKAETALASRPKLGMCQTLQLQLRIAHIPPTSALNPRGGADYPLTPAEMEWQLGLFGAEQESRCHRRGHEAHYLRMPEALNPSTR